MDKLSNLALIAQMIDAAEKNIRSAKQLLAQSMGNREALTERSSSLGDRAASLSVLEGGKVIEGVFDGQNMIGPDGKQYPVPANYASKSKLVEGDVLKLTIADDGSFIYKQIGPIDRRKVIGILSRDERGDFKIVADGKTYKVLLASLTYFKAEEGDQITILVPQEGDATWAAVENVIKSPRSSESVDHEMSETDSKPSSEEEPELEEI
jgi:hypothetical protein